MKPNSLAFSLALAGGTLAASAAVVVLKQNGIIDGDMAQRALGVVLGLMLVVYANFIPKQIARGNARAKRLIGWTFVLAYLAYAAIWAFAPMEYTLVGSLAAVAGALVFTVAYCTLKSPRATG